MRRVIIWSQMSEALIFHLLEKYPHLKYGSISGNFWPTKTSAVTNFRRGKYVVAEAVIPRKICMRYLKTTPEKVAD